MDDTKPIAVLGLCGSLRKASFNRGALRAAIDWASRRPGPPIGGKPCAIMGASPGVIGTARAQYHLR